LAALFTPIWECLIRLFPCLLFLHQGAVLATGDLVATLELDDPSRVQRATLYSGELPQMKQPRIPGTKPQQITRSSLASLRNVLAGYARMPLYAV